MLFNYTGKQGLPHYVLYVLVCKLLTVTFPGIGLGRVLKTSMCVWVGVLSPTVCDSMDCSLPGSFVHGIFWVRILKWIIISYCMGSS